MRFWSGLDAEAAEVAVVEEEVAEVEVAEVEVVADWELDGDTCPRKTTTSILTA
jgi:hypothetical protein